MAETALAGRQGVSSDQATTPTTVDAGAIRIGDVGAWLRTHAVMVAGILALCIPTLISLGRWSWSTETGAHGPIVFATGLWLIWRDLGAVRAQAQRQPLLPDALWLAMLLPLYAVGRIINVLAVESLALWAMLVVLAHMAYGPAIRRLWFPIVYLLFLITPPENVLFVATRPIKDFLSVAVVEVLSTLGYSVASTGVMIQIDSYQLLVATACSGINSLIGICAVSLLYVHLRRGSEPRYALLLTALLIPIAVLANFVRIILLVLMTHHFGESVAQGVFHELTGLGIFILSLLLLMVIDTALQPVANRLRKRGSA